MFGVRHFIERRHLPALIATGVVGGATAALAPLLLPLWLVVAALWALAPPLRGQHAAAAAALALTGSVRGGASQAARDAISGDEFASAIAETLAKTRVGIERARELVAGAVHDLGGSFSGLRKSAEEQQQAVQDILQDAGGEEAEGGAVARFVAGVNDAMRGLVDQVSAASDDSALLAGRVGELRSAMDLIDATTRDSERIVRQTAMLSLNAKIEAVRAGEGGAGFAIVADEVKQLSRSSSSLNQQIHSAVLSAKRAIEQAQGSMESVATRDSDLARGAREQLDAMLLDLNRVNGIVAQNLARVSELTDQLETQVGVAVRNLQFEDIVTQVLGTTLQRLECLGSFCVSLAKAGTGADRSKAFERFRTELASVREPASQQSMNEGEVELF